MFYKTFTCIYASKAKPLCLSLCSQMFDDVERCLIYNIQNVCHANEQLFYCYWRMSKCNENIQIRLLMPPQLTQ